MKWEKVKLLSKDKFKRFVGIKRDTFDAMVQVISESKGLTSNKGNSKRAGAKSKLSTEDQLLMLLMYYREYRTFFHTGVAFGMSEVQCWRIVTRLEKILLSSSLFHLPGKKQLLKSDTEWDIVIVDVSEHSIERPKKNSGNAIPEKRKSIRSKVK